MPDSTKPNLYDRAKRYSSIKYGVSIIDTLYLVLILFIVADSGISKVLMRAISGAIPIDYLGFGVYLAILYIAYSILDFPLNFYRSFVLEHSFGLSNQKIGDWFGDQLKSGAIVYIISLVLFGAFYYIVRNYSHSWWLITSAVWIFFSLIMARLVPVIIIPLFFKYQPLTDEALKARIINLANRMKVKILNVFEINFSKKSLKANAAFLGWGKSRRVLLADTLKTKYTSDEIEVILAHEFSHYRLKHLFKLIAINSFITILTFYLIFKSNSFSLRLFELSSLGDFAGLPLVLLYFVLFGIITEPLENYISRKFERNADMMALKTTGLKDAFISMMEKLSAQNLADRNPSPLIKIFFFDHPPIDERIALARDTL